LKLADLMRAAKRYPGLAAEIEAEGAAMLAAAKRAAGDYERMHWGDPASELYASEAPRVRRGDVLAALGELTEISYDTAKAGEHYRWVHEFRTPLPTLATTEAGRLVIVGGGYVVNERGIVG